MAEQLRYDGKTVVVTGAGGGLGRAYATFYGSRGANVVVNDLGSSLKGEGPKSSQAADSVVREIIKAGGKAVSNYDSVDNGEAIIDTAIKHFGRVDILINNAGILRDVSFKNITDKDWDSIINVHVFGAYKCTRAAWPHFRKQKYGRVINTTSAAGLFGNFGQTNYSAGKQALVGFTETLAKEGAKYNILANVIAPIAGSRMTGTVMPKEVHEALKPEFVVPIVGVLTHESNTDESGSIFEVGGGHVAKFRWERSKGLLLKADLKTYTPSAILNQWDKVSDFSQPSYPIGPANFIELLEEAQQLPDNSQGPSVDFKDKVVLVTGAGAGLGRAYSLLFAKYGAKVVVNDLVNPDTVVKEIRAAGGQAVPNKANVEDGDAVVKGAIDAYGRIDVLINNAGILRDKAFANMDDSLWNSVINTHLRGTYKVTRAAWPFFLKQKYGRVVNTTSTSGIYGNFGQANYAAAKAGILGLSRALAHEGAKYNIYVNTIAPNAGTAMTATVMPEELVQAFKPDYVAPMVLLLSSDKCPDPTGRLYEIGSGWQGRTRWQRSGGVSFPVNQKLTPETVAKNWEKIVTFDGRSSNPETMQDGLQNIMSNLENTAEGSSDQPENNYLKAIAAAKTMDATITEYKYGFKELILYNLGIGARHTDLPLVFENDDDFHPVSSFGVIPPFNAEYPFQISDLVPSFNPMMLLHGEQYLEVRAHSIPKEATLVSYPKLVEVVDKGKSSLVVISSLTKDKQTGEEIFYNESTMYIRGAGGFNGPSKMRDRGASTAANKPPNRAPDFSYEEETFVHQAALYRLMADLNPLHIDPQFSAMGGFKIPILHGLSSMGASTRIIEKEFGPVRTIKVRFSSPVTPGDKLRLEVWKVSPTRIVFQTKNLNTDKYCILGGGADLLNGGQSSKL